MSNLNQQIAIVTGGGTGIGKGIVKRLVEEGMAVVINGVDKVPSTSNQYGSKDIGGFRAAKTLAAEVVAQGGQAIAVEADVTDSGEVDALFNKAVKEYGKVDLLVHSAGVVTAKPVVELTENDWDTVMNINTKGTFLTNRAAARQMLDQGSGKIINVSSIAGKKGYGNLAHYCASKFAVIGFTQALAMELADKNITVNAICPGVVGTAMWDMLRVEFAQSGETKAESYERNVKAFIPQGMPQTEADMAEAIVFLMNSDHVTGQAINVDGGSVM